ncbi:hypothetical protein T4D_11145 [Trichinella pseudospiralis]|uniref:Uncharacterized protein n=1 Tax=Trichinella pseudospiralis TaxID=6337 RepID=A0A0V1F3K6_TRIPS|nr:hypothetical protein T4D_11145 [Trichinella pseudospiralis]
MGINRSETVSIDSEQLDKYNETIPAFPGCIRLEIFSKS